MKKALVLLAVSGTLALAGTVGTAGTADAASDSYTADHVELDLYNNPGYRVVTICNQQSNWNSFRLRVFDFGSGSNADLKTIPGNWDAGSNPVVSLNAGTCQSYAIQSSYKVSLAALFSTNGVEYGTNPVSYN
ncbi:hypothetical protein K7472_14640 [Streptomyces sp. PTM05]|uniref:Secreted protein n=1 Tax=Streptantibioticus parmotrematis TaxID=2873249 RepID=A0ABS7QSB2_9ACTN|nr:hypothetical protein [Streptantibioticus parmotrematis]MBY8886087.1 hypothetical protein [Streptantibioticus parmotrematis]